MLLSLKDDPNQNETNFEVLGKLPVFARVICMLTNDNNSNRQIPQRFTTANRKPWKFRFPITPAKLNQVEIVDHYTRNNAMGEEQCQPGIDLGAPAGEPGASARLTIETLGRFDVKQNGASIAGNLPIKSLLMVTFLACSPGMVARTDIRDLLWGGDRLTSGSTNLRVALTAVRRVLPSALDISRHAIGMARELTVGVDALTLESTVTDAQHRASRLPVLDVETCRTLSARLALYHGHFLQEIAPPNAPHFEIWRRYQQAKYQALAHHGYALLTEHLVARGSVDAAIVAAERWQRIDDLDELPYRTLIRLHAQLGRITEARQWYDIYRSTVFDKLHLPPSEEMRSIHAALIDRSPVQRADMLRQARHTIHNVARLTVGHEKDAEVGSPSIPPHNLGSESTKMYGRERELVFLTRLLLSGRHQLVTLTGADGIGKTCLATALARNLLNDVQASERFGDGIFFVTVEGCRSEAACLAAISAQLNLATSEIGQTLLAQVTEHLAERRYLLIVDGLELRAEQALFVAHFAAAAPSASVIVTARQELGLTGEAPVPIQGLDTISDEPETDDIALLPACRLFLDHAALAVRPFSRREDDRTIAAICRLLDGIPLAIQLAAALTQTHEIGGIYAHLKKRVAQLNASVAEDQDSIVRTVIDMAWQRLDPWLQRAYLRLAAFGNTFDAISASAAALVMPNQLTELQRRSLVQPVPQSTDAAPGTQRYRLHPALRAFAAEALAASNGADAAQHRHAEYFHRFIQQHDVTAGSQDLVSRLDALDREIDNLGVALRNAVASGSWEMLRDDALCLAIYFTLRKSAAFATVFFDEIRSALPVPAPHEATAAIAALDLAQAVLHNRYGHYLAAADLARASLKRAHQDRELALLAHLEIGRAGFFTANYTDAQVSLERALHLAQVGGFAHWECRALGLLGLTLLYAGEHERGVQLSYAALHLSRKQLLILEEGKLLNQLGMIFYYQGRFSAATQHYEHALRIGRTCGDNAIMIATTISLGAIAQQIGDYPRATAHYRDALRMMDDCGDRGNEAISLANLGMTLHYLGENEEGLIHLKRAEGVAQHRSQRDVEAFVFTSQGHASFALGRLQEAEDCFGKALQLRLALRQQQQAMEPLAGLAQVALARGEVDAALAYSERMLPVIRSPWFAAAVEFFRVFWACYQALAANGDSRAPEVLADAYHRLTARAGQIEDEAMRSAYVMRIDVHRAIADAYRAQIQ